MADNIIYEQNGYKNRGDYLQSIAYDYGTDMIIVSSMAEILGDNEDFNGLWRKQLKMTLFRQSKLTPMEQYK